MKTFVIIPAYNEAEIIGNIIEGIKKYLPARQIIVIDDGSSDNTFYVAKNHGAIVYKHIINRGPGAATATGLAAAIHLNADIIITMDADGQHKTEDIPRLIKPIVNNEADVVIGSRLINPKGMPFVRRLFNKIGNLVTYITFGIKVSDSQSGLKSFSRYAAQKIEIKTNGFEFCSEIIREINNHQFKLKEIPIQAIYTDYSMSKGQGLLVGVKTFIRLLLLKFRK